LKSCKRGVILAAWLTISLMPLPSAFLGISVFPRRNVTPLPNAFGRLMLFFLFSGLALAGFPPSNQLFFSTDSFFSCPTKLGVVVPQGVAGPFNVSPQTLFFQAPSFARKEFSFFRSRLFFSSLGQTPPLVSPLEFTFFLLSFCCFRKRWQTLCKTFCQKPSHPVPVIHWNPSSILPPPPSTFWVVSFWMSSFLFDRIKNFF